MALPSTITTNLLPDFKSAVIGPFARIAQDVQGTSSGAGAFGYTDMQEFAQSFIPTSSGPLVSADLYLKTNGGTPADSLQIRLYDHDMDADHFGNLLATAKPISGEQISINQSYKRIVFPSPYTVTAGTTYWLRASRTGALDEILNYSWYTSNANPYANGRLRYLGTGGWVDATPSSDARFKVNVQIAGRYVFAVDKTNNKIRCYKSTDSETWAEQDSTNAPAVSSTANLKSCHAQQFGTTISVFIITSSTRLDIFNYNTSTDAWGSSAFNTTSPTFNVNAAGVASVVAAFRSNEYPANATVLSDYLFVNNGATETVMSAARRRIKLSRRLISGGTWNLPYDVVSSPNSPPNDTTLPGLAVEYDLRGAVVDNAGGLQIFWTQSDDTSIRRRSFLANNTFTTANVVGSPAAVTSNTAAYPMGQPTLYFRSPNWYIAFPYVDGGTLKVAHCRTSALGTASEWVLTSVITATIETSTSNPAVLVPDHEYGGRLFIFYRKSDGKVYYSHDQGTSTWVVEQEFRPGTKTVGGMSIQVNPDVIALAYLDTTPNPDEIRYDQAQVFF